MRSDRLLSAFAALALSCAIGDAAAQAQAQQGQQGQQAQQQGQQAEIERLRGLAKSADPDAVNGPGPLAAALDLRAQGPHRLGGIDDILAFQKSGDPAFAHRKRGQDQRPVRDGLVAGNLDLAVQGFGPGAGEKGLRNGLGQGAHAASARCAARPDMSSATA